MVGDNILVNKMTYRNCEPTRGDIIVFEYPPDPAKDFVKRVVGIGGDILEIRNNQVFVNGKKQSEEYLKQGKASKIEKRNFGPITIPENSLFVLGDNRDHSYDSRYWGFVEVNKVQGKVAIVYWSWDKRRSSVRWKRIGKPIE